MALLRSALPAALAVLALAHPATAQAVEVWLPAGTLAPPVARGGAPAMAADGSGRAVAAWIEGGVPRAALRAPAGPWYRPRSLGGPLTGASDVDSAAGPDGAAVVVWSAGSRVWAASRPAGGRFGRAVPLSLPGRIAVLPRVGIDGDGNAVAVWLSEPPDGGAPRVEGAAREAGQAWSAPVAISAPNERAFAADLAVGAQGQALVVWRADDDDEHSVRASWRPAGGPWEPPRTVSDPSQSVLVEPAAAVGASGDAAAAWTLARGGDMVAQVALRPAGGDWRRPDDLSRPGREVRGARVAVDRAGGVIVVWARDGAVQAAVHADGTPWSPPRDLSGGDVRAAGGRVAVNARGDAVVAWVGARGTDLLAQAAVRPAGRDFSAPATLSAGPLAALGPEAAVDETGGLVAVWQALDPGSALGRSGIQAASGLVSAPPAERPALLDLRARPSRVRPGGRVTIRFGLTSDGPVRFTVRRSGDGRVAASFTVSGRAGANAVRFTVGPGGRTLRRGRYVLEARPAGGTGRVLTLVVLRRR